MENHTSFREFRILAFFTRTDLQWSFFGLVLFLYIIGMIMNLIIITIIYSYSHLHAPLYIFLSNLSIVDIFFTNVTVPKLLDMLLSGNNTVTSTQCFTQMYFFYVAPSTEDMLLLTMAYDRYVAICHPLHYHRILSRKKCSLFMAGSWVIGSLNSLLLTIPASKMSFCNSNKIVQFFCEAKALTKIACAGTEAFYAAVYIDIVLVGLGSFLCSLTSYVKIIRVILGIKSTEGRRKAFSTCSSHVAVITIYYGTATAVYLMPSSQHTSFLEQVITVIFAIVTPMVNPLIYSLRNKELRKAMERIFSVKRKSTRNCWRWRITTPPFDLTSLDTLILSKQRVLSSDAWFLVPFHKTCGTTSDHTTTRSEKKAAKRLKSGRIIDIDSAILVEHKSLPPAWITKTVGA
ncbi:olfactory receptor-like protein OLF4 [Rhinoderma darwinii]|uniref:olfactory receptor-like protein OLF4 n=1 Tax=Rhinoderma darwinii TaxID=43563 RepID=UPI003F6748BE